MISQPGNAQRAIANEKPGYYVQAPEGNRRIVIKVRPKPWDLRLIDWCKRQILLPHRTRRLVHWGLGFPARGYKKARSCLVALAGPRVSDEVADERNEYCWACPTLVGEPREKRTYCGGCNCWHWYGARLRVKNRCERWACPERNHPGTYVEYPDGDRPGCGKSDSWSIKPARPVAASGELRDGSS